MSVIVLRADIKPIVDGEAAHRAASPSISDLTYLRIAILLTHVGAENLDFLIGLEGRDVCVRLANVKFKSRLGAIAPHIVLDPRYYGD